VVAEWDAWTVEEAIAKMVETANALPGTFKAEFALRYHAGVTGPEPWQVEVEGDLLGDEATFVVWGRTAQETIGKAVYEAWARVPPPRS
jgi:hypothetical protein